MEKQSDAMAFVCSLPESEQAQRRAEILTLLQSRTALIRHSDGVELEWAFSQNTARGLLDFILFERLCCDTFSYELAFPPPHNSVHLRVKASPEQVAALHALYS